MSKAALYALAAIGIALALIVRPASGQAAPPAPGDLVDQLLEHDAPEPDAAGANEAAIVADNPPADEAPIDKLLAFWASPDALTSMPDGPNERVRRRLLGGAIEHPEKLPALLWCLPAASQAAEIVKTIFDLHQHEKIWNEEQLASIREWTRRRSRHFRDELIAAARSVAFNKNYTLDHEEDLIALAQMDWAAARPILRELSDNKDIHVSAVALQFLAERAVSVDSKAALPELFARLRKIADNRSAPGFARQRAFGVLLSVTWDGRDAWYLSLFADSKLRSLEEDHLSFNSPLATLIGEDPKHFVPLVVKLLDSTDAAVRENAALQLVAVQQPDALRPLLPALIDDKKWPDGFRTTLLASLLEVNVPEATAVIVKAWPRLNEDDRVSAAHVLAAQHAPQAPALLKAAMALTTNTGIQESLAAEMLDCHALTEQEIVAALEAACANSVKVSQPAKEGAPEPVTPPLAQLGNALMSLVTEQNPIAEKLLRRADALEASNPQLAAQIRQELSNWPVPAVDNDLVARARRRGLNEDLITAAIDRLPGIRATAEAALRDLVDRGGKNAGFAAALLGDDAAAHAILHGKDRAAVGVLLAVGRLARTKFALDDVAACLADTDPHVSRAAESYLIAEDSPPSRRIVLARHPDEAMILGGHWTMPGKSSAGKPSLPETLTEQLRAEILSKDGPDAIYALLSDSGAGDDGQRIIRVRGEQAVLYLEVHGGRGCARSLTREEFRSLLDLLHAEKFDDLPPLKNGLMDGTWYDYLHITRAGGRRVFINHVDSNGTDTPYDRVRILFRTLASTGAFIPQYRAQDRVSGLRLLRPVSEQWITQVWKQGDDMRVFIGSPTHPRAWHAWRNGQVAEAVNEPAGAIPRQIDKTDVPEKFGIKWARCSPRYLALAGEDVILCGDIFSDLGGGLWRCRKGRTPQPVTAGSHEFAHPVTTAGGAWAVATEGIDGWTNPRPLVRVRLSDGEIHQLDLPADRSYEAVARLPDEKILAMSWKDDADTEDRLWWVVDPATGKVEPATGDFEPLKQAARPLQPSSQKGIVFAAMTSDAETRIGTYDLRHFKFTPLVTLPEFRVSSEEMWVDEAEGVVYFCMNGDLLSVPIRH